MKEIIFYAIAGLIAMGIHDLIFFVTSTHCQGLCDTLSAAFIIVVVIGICRKLPFVKRIFGQGV